jgi:maleate cis-trans isomerase
MTEHRIGLLAPCRELPGELADAVAGAREPVLLWQVVTAAADSHELGDLRETGSGAVLLDGVERMRRWRPSVVAFACTSGSFVGGRDWALSQARTIATAAGVPATSTSLAFVEALNALGFEDVALLSPYPQPATDALVGFLAEWGVTVRCSAALGCPGGRESERLGADEVESALAGLDPSLPTVFPDTAVWGLEIQRELAPRSRSPLLVANQVTLWNAFDLAGAPTDLPGFGPLAGLRGAGLTTASARPGGS